MFANSKMQIAPGITPRLKIPSFGESHPCLRGRSEIGRSTDEPGQVWRNRVQNFRGRIAPRNSFRIGGENRNVFRPISRQLALLNLAKFRSRFREFLGVVSEQFRPLLPRFPSPLSNTRCEILVHSVRHQKLGIRRPAISQLGQSDFFLAKRLSMRGARSFAMWRTVADVAIDNNDRWPP